MLADMVVLVTMLILVTSSWALDPDLMREMESRAEWQELWTEERLMLCRSRLRHNLDAICGKAVYHRSPVVQSRPRRWPPHTKRNTDIYLEVHDTQTARSDNKKEKRMRTMSVNLPATRIEINPSVPDTGQHSTHHTRSPFLSVHQANLFVTTWVGGGHRRQRRQSSSITSECCTTVGCTWEEYAEYCPTSSRLRPGVTLI